MNRREKVFFQSMRDFVWTAELIHSLIQNELDFTSVYVTKVVEYLVESFAENAGILDESFQKHHLLSWVSDFCPVSVFDQSFAEKLFELGNLNQMVDSTVLKDFHSWMDTLLRKFDSEPELTGFLDVLRKIKRKLQSGLSSETI